MENSTSLTFFINSRCFFQKALHKPTLSPASKSSQSEPLPHPFPLPTPSTARSEELLYLCAASLVHKLNKLCLEIPLEFSLDLCLGKPRTLMPVNMFYNTRFPTYEEKSSALQILKSIHCIWLVSLLKTHWRARCTHRLSLYPLFTIFIIKLAFSYI